MQITLNGKITTTSDSASVADLLTELGLAKKRVAVEVNREIVPRSEHGNYRLQDADQVEIVHAIGGG